MISKGVKPSSNENPIKVQLAEKKKDDSALVAEEMAEGDDGPAQEEKKEKEEKQKKNDEFNRVSDDIKSEAASEALGTELIQLTNMEVQSVKANIMRSIRKKSTKDNLNLA